MEWSVCLSPFYLIQQPPSQALILDAGHLYPSLCMEVVGNEAKGNFAHQSLPHAAKGGKRGGEVWKGRHRNLKFSHPWEKGRKGTEEWAWLDEGRETGNKRRRRRPAWDRGGGGGGVDATK